MAQRVSNKKTLRELKSDLIIAQGQLEKLQHREDVLWGKYQVAERKFDDIAIMVGNYESYIKSIKIKISRKKQIK